MQATSVWVCIAQLVEHCSAHAVTTDSIEAPKNFFFFLGGGGGAVGAKSQLLKLRFDCDGHIFISLKAELETIK